MRIDFNNRWSIPAATGVSSFLIGIGTGYMFGQLRIRTAQKRVELIPAHFEEFKERVDKGFEDLKAHMNHVIEEEEEADDEEDDEEPSSHSVFAEKADPDWNYEAELLERDPEKPYIIHIDEFIENEPNHSNDTLTYYKGDDILVDAIDVPIYDYKNTVGELKFGHGSNDPNVVYVRNEKLNADYEILLDHGYFQVEVLGHEIETNLSHERSPLLRFREP